MDKGLRKDYFSCVEVTWELPLFHFHHQKLLKQQALLIIKYTFSETQIFETLTYHIL